MTDSTTDKNAVLVVSLGETGAAEEKLVSALLKREVSAYTYGPGGLNSDDLRKADSPHLWPELVVILLGEVRKDRRAKTAYFIKGLYDTLRLQKNSTPFVTVRVSRRIGPSHLSPYVPEPIFDLSYNFDIRLGVFLDFAESLLSFIREGKTSPRLRRWISSIYTPDIYSLYIPLPAVEKNLPNRRPRGGSKKDLRRDVKTKPRAAKRRPKDDLTCSVFSSPVAASGDEILVRAFAHLPKQKSEVALKASADPTAGERGSGVLGGRSAGALASASIWK